MTTCMNEALTYDEMRNALDSHGSAIKSVDPQAIVFGPVAWGWTE